MCSADPMMCLWPFQLYPDVKSPPSQICYEIKTLFGRLKFVTVTTHVNSQLLSTAALEGKHGKFANLSEQDDWLIDEIFFLGGEGKDGRLFFQN